ncbi:MAG TPA: TolC family protein [Bryobacteraceae bacterium]|jgi:outer membrane protein TolC|nr:TolC family protein [Bryobacteraceae bacterium]
MKSALALALCCLQTHPVYAQASSPGDRSPQVVWNSGFLRGEFRPGFVSSSDFRDSTRIGDLIRAGQLYLSLQDAIALALENNLDLELERYGVRMATTDTYRAQGGGVLRGVPLAVNEAPAGIGGPSGSPLLTTAATGATPQSTVSVSVTDTQLIGETQNNLGVTGTFPFANGPLIPLFDPTLTATLQGQRSNTPQLSTLTTNGTDLTSNSFIGNAGYLQGFAPGTQISAGFLNQYQDQNAVRNLFSPFSQSSLGVTVTQPLLRGFGSELNRRFIHIARNSEKISDYVFQQQVISTISGVIRLYDDLVSLNADMRVKQQTLATAQRLLEDNRNKVDQGTLAPIEATRAQAQTASAQQDLINAEGYVRQQELILKNVLARNWSDDPIVHDARIIPTDTLSLEPLPTQPPAEIATQALANRPELMAAKLQLTNSEISLKGTKNELLPEIDLVGTFQSTGLAGPLNPTAGVTGTFPGVGGNYGTVLDQIVKGTYPTYSVGINLTLPVRNRVAQADVARDELQVRQTQVRLKQLENQIRAEVEDALIALQRTRAAYEAAQQTTKLQEQSLEIEQEKFDVGLSTNFLVIQYQGYVAQARSTEVAALDAYAKAKTQYERSVGLTLNNHNVSIDEAFKGTVGRVSTPAVPAGTPRQ